MSKTRRKRHERIAYNRRRIDTRRWDVVVVTVENSLGIVLSARRRDVKVSTSLIQGGLEIGRMI